jgi:Enoyl-(Acyl carrier protein) reductase
MPGTLASDRFGLFSRRTHPCNLSPDTPRLSKGECQQPPSSYCSAEIARSTRPELKSAPPEATPIRPPCSRHRSSGSTNDIEEARRQALARLPIGRMGTVTDLTKGIVFLASDDAGFMTGSGLVVDAGITAQ